MSQMNELQKTLFQLLIEFDEICKKYDIKYLLAAGASLGAVRNRSFIPWDDDIDLYLTRENWNKLRDIIETEDNVLPNGRSLIYKENTPYYCNPLPRYVNNNSTTIYISQSLPAKACGQHLELFIFDPIPKDETEKKKYLDLLHVYTELLSPYFIVNKNASLNDWSEHYKLYEHYCNRIKKEGEEKVIRELETILQQYEIDNCEQYCMRWGIKNYIYDKIHFEEEEFGIFEGRKFPIGKNTEGILRVAYGDNWMYIPEYEEQISHNGIKNSIPFTEYTSRYLPKINRKSVFEKFKKNKQNNASSFYIRKKIDMLVAKEKVTVGSIHVHEKLDGNETYLKTLLDNKEFKQLFNEFEVYTKLQMIDDVRKFNIMVPISDANLSTLLFALIEKGEYYNVNKFLNIRKLQKYPLSNELYEINNIIEYLSKLSIARYDKKDYKLVQKLVDEYPFKYGKLDIMRAKLWIMENNSKTKEDFEKINILTQNILNEYPFDGEVMAIQAKAKFECGLKEESMKLYKNAILNTRNGLIWQKVEDESGISRMNMERELIEELNYEN